MYDLEKEIEQAESLEDLVRVLEILFNRGYAVDPEGRLYKILELVAQVNGLRIVIRPDEHPPPHFHVTGGDVDAAFSIVTGDFLKGSIDNRKKRLVEYWYKPSRRKLIDVWNRTRPSDCPVGPIEE